MADWILHHYESSPYGEKARLMLGRKGLAWRSLEVSVLPLRPHLHTLLGGFRRIPVLQHGADFYCDSRLLPDVLDSVIPQPLLLPAHARALSALIANWAEPRVFAKMGPVRFESRDELQAMLGSTIDVADFARDRAPFMAPAADTRRNPMVRASARDHVHAYLGMLEQLLAASGDHLCGATPAAADFSAYHTVWWLRRPPSRDAVLQPYERVRAWADRLAAIGHGRHDTTTPEVSLQQAKAAQSDTPWLPAWPAVPDERIDHECVLNADDYGRDPITGVLTAVSDRHFTLTREADGIGRVHLHFPKVGYEVSLAAT